MATMTGQHNPQFTGVLALLLVGCSLVDASPLPMDNNSVTLILDDVGFYLKLVAKEVLFPPPNLTLEVNITMFETLVCPLFGINSRIEQTLQSLPEDDLRRHNVSILSFLTRTQTQALCARACSGDEQCVSMNCNMSSIADICLNLLLVADQVAGLDIQNGNPQRNNFVLVPLWLSELLDWEPPSQDVAFSLKTFLETDAFVVCSIPYEGQDEDMEITCLE